MFARLFGPATVTLKNNTVFNKTDVDRIMGILDSMLINQFALQYFYEKIHGRNPNRTPEFSFYSIRGLQYAGLMDQSYQVSDLIKNVALCALHDNGDKIEIRSPLAETASAAPSLRARLGFG